MTLTLGIALFAGLVSFLSPCVLPLIPGFLSFLAGSSLSESKNHRREIFLTSLAFVLGFSVVFSLLGILLNTLLKDAAYEVQLWLSRVGGIFIILFGLVLTGLLKLPFLQREYKFHPKFKFQSKLLTAFVFGSAFAAGWTPCVGPVLGGILGLAASEPGSAFALLLAYSIGLGLPFLLVGLFTAEASSLIQKIRPYIQYVNVVFGIILIAIGILAFTQNLSLVANFSFLNKLLLK